ncbi:MAG: hypothetical protein J6O04_09375 [Selenomonadaceae bacterium]|nr:hypothetical protein [Selenomonadaceae bacterium]
MPSTQLGKRMSWNEIKAVFPHRNVGLVDCVPNRYNIVSAIVKYTDKDKTYSELIRMAVNKEIVMRYTTMDEDDGIQ